MAFTLSLAMGGEPADAAGLLRCGEARRFGGFGVSKHLEMSQRPSNPGVEAADDTPREFAGYSRPERAEWAAIIRKAGIHIQ